MNITIAYNYSTYKGKMTNKIQKLYGLKMSFTYAISVVEITNIIKWKMDIVKHLLVTTILYLICGFFTCIFVASLFRSSDGKGETRLSM